MLDLKEFTKKFRKLRDKGFVKSRRKGPTGVGHTLEAELGLDENNVALSDLTFAELKAHRVNSSSLITLFTFNRKVWKVDPLVAVKKYGTEDANGRVGIYFTMGPTPNSAGLFTRFEKESVDLRHLDGTRVVWFSLSDLYSRFMQKVPRLLFATAEVEERAGTEYFHYVRAQMLHACSEAGMSMAFRSNNLAFDVRLRLMTPETLDGPTAVRVNESQIPSLYSVVNEI